MQAGLVLSAALLSSMGTDKAYGQTPGEVGTSPEKLEEVQVIGSRIPLNLQQSARMVTIMDRAAIQASPARTVNDLLKYAAGVDVRQRGDMGVQTDVSLRGGTFDQITILLDGINICDPQTGHNAFDFPVDISEVERIEVLMGPAGKSSGASSLLGAINIVTRKEPDHGGSVHLETGSFGFVGGGLKFQQAGKKFYNSVSGNYSRSDGYSRSKAGHLNADFQSGKLFYRGGYRSDEVDLKWHFGFLDKDYGANTFYSTASDEQFEHVRKFNLAFQAATKGKYYRFRPTVYWNRSEDRFEFFRGRPDKSPFNFHQSDVFGLNLNNEVSSILGRTSFGAELRNEGILSTALGEPLKTPVPVRGYRFPALPSDEATKAAGAPGAFGIIGTELFGNDGAADQPSYTKGLNRTDISFYLEHTVLLKIASITAGVVAVKNTGNEMKFRFYPGVDVKFNLPKHWNIFASWNTSLRMPTFTELYYSVGGHQADKNLKPEEIQSAELGFKYEHKGIRASVTGFYSNGRGMIDWIKDLNQGEDAPWQSVNHTVINTAGVSPELCIDFPTLLDRENFFLGSLNLSYNYIWQDKKAGKGIQSKYALEYLRNKFVAQVNFNIWKALHLNLSYRWQDRVGNYQKGDEMVAYHPYSVLDARLSWDAKDYSVYVEGNNLTNHVYYDHGNIPQPGIWVRVGGIYRFRFK